MAADQSMLMSRTPGILFVRSANAELLRITPSGEVIAPSLEAASEAGRVFAESLRGHIEVIRRALRDSNLPCVRAASLVSAAKAVLDHRVGELPGEGWLRDSAASRAALAYLAAVVEEATDAPLP